MKKHFLYALLSATFALFSLIQPAAAQDVYQVAPTMYKVISDTLGIRIMEATYRPGEGSALHSHPDFALYVLEGGQVELTNKSGQKQEVNFKTGTGVVLPADTHSARNTGTSVIRLVVVEVSRARQ